jgi:hypothetical protein
VGKSKRGSKEYSREQKLIHENKRLKRELSQLRKQLARIDLDRYDTVKEMIQEHYQEERAQEGQDILDNLKKSWTCHECHEGHLEIILYNKLDSTWYFRKCVNCGNRTKSQKYTPDVKGIIKNQ